MIYFTNIEKESIKIYYEKEYGITVMFYLNEKLIERLPVSISGKTIVTGSGWVFSLNAK